MYYSVLVCSKLVNMSLASHLKLSAEMSPQSKEEQEYIAKVPYANAMGSLMYTMVCTRPNLSHSVGMVSIYMHAVGK